jgi:hypothetical protein
VKPKVPHARQEDAAASGPEAFVPSKDPPVDDPNELLKVSAAAQGRSVWVLFCQRPDLAKAAHVRLRFEGRKLLPRGKDLYT